MYLYQITNDREREYIKNYVSKVEKTGFLFNLFLKFELIIPFMLFKVSIPQFVNVIKGYGTMTDFFIALFLFVFGILFSFVFYYLGFERPACEKKFLKQVEKGELYISKVKILKIKITNSFNGVSDHYYVTSYIDETGNVYNEKFVKAYGYNGSNKYEFGYMYNDVDKGYSFEGIIPLME